MLGNPHKVKLIICRVLPQIYTHFKCIRIFYILQEKLFSVVIHFSCFMFMSMCMSLSIFCGFMFLGKIALWTISYVVKL